MSITRALTRTLSLACCIGLTAVAWSGEEGKKITIDQLPAAVKEALLKQAGGGEIKEIEEETKKGQTIYEAEVVANGVTTEVKLDATGKVLRSHFTARFVARPAIVSSETRKTGREVTSKDQGREG